MTERPQPQDLPLHVTYGVYLNGDWKRNVVRHVDLQYHIEYNTGLRPGRCLIVDRVVVNRGYLAEEQAQAFLDRIPSLERDVDLTRPSAVYV